MSSTVTKSPDRRRPLQPPIAHYLVLLCTRQHAPGTRRPPADRGAAWWMDAACLTSETRSEASPGSRFPTPYLQPGNLSTRRRGYTVQHDTRMASVILGVADRAVRRYCPWRSPNQFAVPKVVQFGRHPWGHSLCHDCRMQFRAIPYLFPLTIRSTSCPKRWGGGGILPGQRGFRILPDNNSGLA